MFAHVLSASALLMIFSADFSQSQYVPPEVLVQPLKPVGLRMSIPHEEGITLVAYHVRFNEEFYALEAGTIAIDIIKPRNGRWVYEDKTTRLKDGDIIYYWIHVVYRGLGYNLLNQEYRVTDAGGSQGHSNCTQSVTKLYDAKKSFKYSCSGQLIFEEKFVSPTEFSKNKWTIVEQFSTSPDYEFAVYRNNPENVLIKNGLKLSTTLLKNRYGDLFIRRGSLDLKNCTRQLKSVDCYREAQGWNILPPITSGKINTEKSMNFEFGRIEIRAKFPHGDWLYPLMVLEPVNNQKSTDLSTAQIRIASAAGNADLKTTEGMDISGHILWGGATGLNSQVFEERLDASRLTQHNDNLWADSFHTYELTWRPNKLSLKVDDQLYEDKQVQNLPSNMPFYLTIGLAVGGLSEFPDGCRSGTNDKPWRNSQTKALFNFYNSTNIWSKTWRNPSFEVEYVKIYAL